MLRDLAAELRDLRLSRVSACAALSSGQDCEYGLPVLPTASVGRGRTHAFTIQLGSKTSTIDRSERCGGDVHLLVGT